jgi:hypothetical protein
LICPVKIKATPPTYPVLAQKFAQDTGIDENTLLAALTDPTYCDGYITSRHPDLTVAAASIKRVELAEDGYPVSLNNPVWNLCVRGTATLADIRNNPDVVTTRSGKIIHKSCDAYRTAGSNLWSYPDDSFLTFTITPHPGAKPTVTVPSGYVIVPSRQQTAALSQ